MQRPRPVTDGVFEMDGTPRLRAAHCAGCGQLHFPASTTCPYCGRDGSTATLVGPSATLRLFTAVASRPPGYRGALPYGFGVVEIDGTGLEVITRLTESDPGRLRPGQPMRLVVETLCTDDDGTPVLTYAFAPVET